MFNITGINPNLFRAYHKNLSDKEKFQITANCIKIFIDTIRLGTAKEGVSIDFNLSDAILYAIDKYKGEAQFYVFYTCVTLGRVLECIKDDYDFYCKVVMMSACLEKHRDVLDSIMMELEIQLTAPKATIIEEYTKAYNALDVISDNVSDFKSSHFVEKSDKPSRKDAAADKPEAVHLAENDILNLVRILKEEDDDEISNNPTETGGSDSGPKV